MPTYRGVTTVQVNFGDTALFWKDMWNNSIYTTSFPRAFSFAANEDISIQQFLATTDMAATFRLPLSMQAHDELRQIQREVSHFNLDGSKDQWICTWGAQTFKTSAYYTFVFRDVQTHEGFKWLWKAKSIPKIKVFGWFLLSDRLNTRNMLNRRHYNIGNNLDCLLCNQHVEETVEHLLFRFTFSRTCWHLLGIHWPPQGNRLDMISHLKMRHRRKMIMDIFLVAAWSLWK